MVPIEVTMALLVRTLLTVKSTILPQLDGISYDPSVCHWQIVVGLGRNWLWT